MDGVTTFIVALWGALLSTLLLGWTVYRDITGRGKLNVTCSLFEENFLAFTVANAGRRPIMLLRVGIKTPNGETNFFPLRTLPIMLLPGKYHLESCELSLVNEDLRYLAAWDSLENVHKAPRKVIKKLKGDIEAVRRQEIK